MLVIEFPAPNPPLSINQANKMHWGTRSRRLKPWRQATFDAVISLPSTVIAKEVGTAQRLEATIHLPFKTKRRRDPHNYVGTNVKAIVDGLVDAGMILDDTPEYITVNEPVLLVGEGNHVVVYLSEAPGYIE